VPTSVVRAGSHYGRRSRGRRFPPIKLQETKSSASRPFTLWPKFKGHRILKWLFLKKATDSCRKFGLDENGNPNYDREAVGFFSLNNKSLTRSWPLDWRGYVEQGIKWHAPLSLDFAGFTLWLSKSRGRGSSWPKVWTLRLAFEGFTLCLAEGYAYYILLAISAHFSGLSTKFGHSIAQPLDLDGRSVNRPLGVYMWRM
jgi:hypothetical protein